ncbi:MAG: carbohydrate-binding domain-containing protein [Oscillospiraceae bacterium]|nr:carbohydrate-binding domain-containing protein [Oscillospiraceae bacterium]
MKKKHIPAIAGAAVLAVSVTGTALSALFGDVNRDESFDAADAVRLADYLTAKTEDIDGAAADFNSDGSLTAADLTLLKRSLLSGEQSGTSETGENYVTAITYTENAVILKNADEKTVPPDLAENVTVSSGTRVTITKPTDDGEISIDGECSEGQLIADADKTLYPDGKITVSLRGLTLANSSDSPIYAASAGDEFVISVKKDTVNTVSDGQNYQNADGSAGAVYSCDDLKIKGKGKLIVNGNCEDGIVSKDDLKIWNGEIEVTAADDGIRGKDSVRIGDPDDTDGYDALKVTVRTAGGDGIKSTGTDTDKGFVRINGGTISIDSYLDGISGEQKVEINGGTIGIHTYEGAGYQSGTGGNQGGRGDFGGSSGKNKTDVSAKGIKAVGLYSEDGSSWLSGGDLLINGGSVTIDSSDDCLHCGGDMYLYGGEMLLQTADDGAHSDHSMTIGSTAGNDFNAVKIVITKGCEGMEAQHITQNCGTVIAHVTDDGFNAGGGNDGSGNQGGFNPWGGGFSSGGSADDYTLNFNGGFTLVDVENSGDHDGIDSNGNITVTGGIIVTNGNQPFDYGAERSGKITCTGGIWIENSRTSRYMETQPAYLVNGGSVSQGTRISLVGSDGTVIVSFIAGKQVSVLRAGGDVSGAKFYTGGTLSEDAVYFQTLYSDQSAAYGGTLSGGTLSQGSGRS